MSTSSLEASAPSRTQFSLLRDIVVVVAVTLVAAWLAAHFELNEVVFALTRRWEALQLDELPITLLVLALCLMWLSWRRYIQARIELLARHAAEARLAAALRANRALGHQHLRALEAERKHLARELHDELGQYMNAIKLDAVAIREGGDSVEQRSEAASRMLQAVDHMHAVVSDMIRRLRPAGLDELGLVAAIESCVDQWRQRLPEIGFTLSADGDLEELGESTNLTVYRLVQECLTNSYKHARASRVEVQLRHLPSANGSDDELTLSVQDDGRGMDPQAHSAGFGLGSMRERVEMIGGRLEIRSAPGEGCVIEARIPLSGEGR